MSPAHDLFRQNGCYVARGLLPPGEIAAVLASIERTIRRQLGHIGAPAPQPGLHAALRCLYATDLPRYKSVLAALWRKSDVFGLMRHPSLFSFLRQSFGWADVFLPGGEVALLMASDLQIPDGYFGLGTHQDFASVQGSLDGVVAWIPLTPVDLAGWTIEVALGSHRAGLITDVDHTSIGWEVRPADAADANWIAIEAEPGDVVFMSVFTLHRSLREGAADRMRLALSTRFDNAEEPTFEARAYPTAYQRTVKRDLYVPDFPTPAQMAALFG